MGEVYKATDTRLRRAVAIKVIRDGQIDDAERVRRFESEARAAAALDHPNILTVHDVGVHDGAPYIVSELLEGETLEALLEGGAVPVRKAVDLALQVAHGLAAAHDKGIVHRDLKPSNLWLTRDGRLKILDFGLAKLTQPEPGAAGGGVTHTTSTSPGTVVGTIGYMSPEQVRGEPLDARSDIFAFGAVLYEMLAGRRAFDGATAADVMSAILRQDPAELASGESAIPPSLDRIVRRCLEKKPEQRFRSLHDLAFALEAVSPDTGAPLAVAVQPAPSWSLLRLLLAMVVLGLAALALAIAIGRRSGGAEGLLGVLRSSRAAPEPAPPVRLSVELGADASLATGWGPAAILSPDGKLLAFAARKAAGQRPQLYVRRLEQLQASPLSGTEDTRSPFFSSDSQWIGFFAEGKLKKVAVTGGAAVTLCDSPEDRGGTWSEDGTILFTPRAAGGLSRVSSAGGTPEVLTTPDQAAQDASHRWPQALPGGKAVLFTAGAGGDFEGASIVVQSLPKGPRKVLQRGGYHGRYLRSGHIVYIHEGTLFAAAFDLGRLELTGPPAPVLEGVTANTGNAGAQFAFSDRGTLVFLPGQSAGASVPIQWMDKDGKTEPLRALAGNYNNIRFSPDGQRLAMDLRESRELDVWVYEWGRDTMSRLTSEPGEDLWPAWTPDGRRIAFASTRADKATENLYWQRADGTGEAERLTESKNPQYPASWHPSGKFLAFGEFGPQTSWDLLILPMEGDDASGWKPANPTAFLNSPFIEAEAAFSPDGRWLAYQSNESGRLEVYVRPFPGPGGKWQVSTGGGLYPIWSRNRKELFFRTLDLTLMVAPYAVEGDSFRAEKPRQWSPGLAPARGGAANRAFDLHPDGQRFAVLKAAELQTEEKRDKVVFIENFFEELHRVAPAAKQ